MVDEGAERLTQETIERLSKLMIGRNAIPAYAGTIEVIDAGEGSYGVLLEFDNCLDDGHVRVAIPLLDLPDFASRLVSALSKVAEWAMVISSERGNDG